MTHMEVIIGFAALAYVALLAVSLHFDRVNEARRIARLRARSGHR